jgi:hypothetical protein
MAAPTKTANAEGALYELVSRGNKDVYFFQDFPDSKFLFDNAYEPQAPYSFEIRRVPPRTAVEFGRMVEFDIDVVGDVMTNPTLLIQLPTWLPAQQAALVQQSVITDASGVAYGYVNGIGYFLLQQVQLFQDNILLQEFSGDALWAFNKTQGTYATNFVGSGLAGEHDGSLLSVSRSSAPPMLRVELPLIGCQQGCKSTGFPLRAITRHTYRLKIKLRRLEDLVESTQAQSQSKPAPWSLSALQQQTAIGVTSFQPIPRSSIPPLTLLLETRQVYVPRDLQDELQSKPMQIPYRRWFENTFSQSQLDYASVLQGGTSPASRRLDGRHPTSRMLWFFRTQDDIHANRLWKIQTNLGGSYYNTVSLQIAGQDRELPRTPLVWRDITNHAKEDLDTGNEIATMNWGLGAIAPSRFPGANSQPTGTINMTTADRPTFYIDLANPQSITPNTQLTVLTEGWAVFQTDGEGRAELFQMN